jgi:hypothetical protein
VLRPVRVPNRGFEAQAPPEGVSAALTPRPPRYLEIPSGNPAEPAPAEEGVAPMTREESGFHSERDAGPTHARYRRHGEPRLPIAAGPP